MSVSFNEEPRYTRFASQPAKGIAGKLVEWKFAKDARRANYILVGVIIIAAVAAITIPLLSSSSAPKLTPQEQLQLRQMPMHLSQ